ncbi:hypothetical protein JXK06_02060 [Patescibacteria group bacterium]|nr:hypothetical protein [Patescibacteria group bacterium]
MKKFKFFLLSIFCLFLFSSSIVLAQSYGLDETISEVPAYQAQADESYDEKFVATKVGDMIGLVLSFIGVLFLILIIYGGISWMTAGGNEQNVEKAKTIIINAVIGLLIVIFAYTITSFIGNQFTN